MDTPTITVSNTIVEALKKIGNKVFLVPNFPLFKEIEPIREPIYHPSLSSVYAGVEAKGPIKPSHRNLEGFIEIFQNNDIGKLYVIGWDDYSTNNVIYRGFLKRDQMYKEMQDHSVGLLPFKNHWSHIFISPNKAYEYAHAGLFVMCTPGFKSVFDILQEHCMLYENNDDLKNKLSYMNQNLDELYSKRLKMYKFARNHILWEKYEKNIFEAYKAC
jgi:glycosyltransferase involved in cell wall biosynthesis